MNLYSLIEISTTIFVTMGPIKVLVTFAEKSSGLESALRRRIAIKAVGVATMVGLIFKYRSGNAGCGSARHQITDMKAMQ